MISGREFIINVRELITCPENQRAVLSAGKPVREDVLKNGARAVMCDPGPCCAADAGLKGKCMYELVKLTEHDYYIESPAKIGLVKLTGDEAILIDSGSDKDAGKKVLRILENEGWKLKAIFNTHSHADHIGGNRFLQEKTGCAVFARGMECAYTNEPLLEPAGLYGGLPFKELRHKFLMAEKSDALRLNEDPEIRMAAGEKKIAEPWLDDGKLPGGMMLLKLPGHSFDMAGFLTAEGTAYIADCVSSEETLKKYGIGYMWNPDEALKTLEYVQTIEADRFVPAHAAVTDDIIPLAKLNIDAIRGVQEKILEICAEPLAFERILKNLFDAYAMTMNVQQYVLIGSTLRSYLSCLYSAGKITFEFRENEMLWRAV